MPRRQAGFNSRRLRPADRIGSRPDRIAFWAVVMAVVVMIAAAASAHAATAGPGSTIPGGNGTLTPTRTVAAPGLAATAPRPSRAADAG